MQVLLCYLMVTHTKCVINSDTSNSISYLWKCTVSLLCIFWYDPVQPFCEDFFTLATLQFMAQISASVRGSSLPNDKIWQCGRQHLKLWVFYWNVFKVLNAISVRAVKCKTLHSIFEDFGYHLLWELCQYCWTPTSPGFFTIGSMHYELWYTECLVC